jgi:argininosuccinate lyase
MDAVSDRDFAVEFLFHAALSGIHLSRLAELLILFSTAEYGYIELSDTFTTGSSLMPQKKNPDMLELIRGKAGVLIGYLTGLLSVLKGLPSAYDKDLQEDKEPVFHAFDILCKVLPVMAGVIETLIIKPNALQAALDPAMLATDLADYLVRKGVPFRKAHELVGQVVRLAEESGVKLDQVPVKEMSNIFPGFDTDVSQVFNMETSVALRNATGGTAPEQVRRQIKAAEILIEEEKNYVASN